MSDLSERIVALPPDKQAWLLQKLKEKARQSTPRPAQATSPSPDSWVVRSRPNEQAALRLFCFPYAGGAASVFRQWQASVPEEVEICAVQLPGREYRIGEAAYRRIPDLLNSLTEAIAPYLDRPFALFGHSMGALISFALARHLRQTLGKLPTRLYLAAYRAAHLPNPNIKIYHLPSEVFRVVLRAEGIPEAVLQNEELIQAMLPTLRADFELCDTYDYREDLPLECPLTVYGGLDDVRVRASDLEAWRMHCSGPFNLKLFPGSHFFLHSAQYLLLAELSRDLAECLMSSGPVPA